jgi:fermentation-respiration switch protein FrsA (DUF1100 family)
MKPPAAVAPCIVSRNGGPGDGQHAPVAEPATVAVGRIARDGRISNGHRAEVKNPTDRGYADFAEGVAGEGLGAVIFNFRGCGLSGGNFDIAGWRRDLEAVVEYVLGQPQFDAGKVGLLGFSGGAAVCAAVAAADTRVKAVALAACPADLDSIAKAADLPAMLNYFRGVQIIRDADFPTDPRAWQRAFGAARPEDYVALVAPRQLLLVHGDADETVPPEHARRLYAAAGKPKTLQVFPGLGHRLRHDAAAMDYVISWLKRSLR